MMYPDRISPECTQRQRILGFRELNGVVSCAEVLYMIPVSKTICTASDCAATLQALDMKLRGLRELSVGGSSLAALIASV